MKVGQMSFSPYSKLHVMVAIVTLAKVCMWCDQDNPTIKQSYTTAVQVWKSYLQITTLNLNHFKMVEDMGLKITALRSTWTSIQNIMTIYQVVQKLLVWDT
jgi:hypothetical protein